MSLRVDAGGGSGSGSGPAALTTRGRIKSRDGGGGRPPTNTNERKRASVGGIGIGDGDGDGGAEIAAAAVRGSPPPAPKDAEDYRLDAAATREPGNGRKRRLDSVVAADDDYDGAVVRIRIVDDDDDDDDDDDPPPPDGGGGAAADPPVERGPMMNGAPVDGGVAMDPIVNGTTAGGGDMTDGDGDVDGDGDGYGYGYVDGDGDGGGCGLGDGDGNGDGDRDRNEPNQMVIGPVRNATVPLDPPTSEDGGESTADGGRPRRRTRRRRHGGPADASSTARGDPDPPGGVAAAAAAARRQGRGGRPRTRGSLDGSRESSSPAGNYPSADDDVVFPAAAPSSDPAGRDSTEDPAVGPSDGDSGDGDGDGDPSPTPAAAATSSAAAASSSGGDASETDTPNASAADDDDDDVDLAMVLRGPPMEFLASRGITRESHLRAVNKSESSPLVRAMLDWRGERGMPGIRPTSCVRSLYDWLKKARLHHRVVAVAEEEEARAPPSPVAVAVVAAVPPPPRGVVAGEEEAPTPVAVAAPPPPPRRRRGRKKSVVSEPLGAISQTCRSFLASRGIVTAEQFLSAKSMQLANAFVTWREEMGMPPLKGTGAIASVSGWKGQVRSFMGRRQCQSGSVDGGPPAPSTTSSPRRRAGGLGKDTPTRTTGLGRDTPTTRRPGMAARTTDPPVSRREGRPDDRECAVAVGDMTAMETVRHLCRDGVAADEVTGIPCRMLAVRNGERNVIFEFKIDVRTSSMPHRGRGAFLTYLGAKISTRGDAGWVRGGGPGGAGAANRAGGNHPRSSPGGSSLGGNSTTAGFLSDHRGGYPRLPAESPGRNSSTTRLFVPLDHREFSSYGDGCGLVDLGAAPLPAPVPGHVADGGTVLTSLLATFIFGPGADRAGGTVPSSTHCTNSVSPSGHLSSDADAARDRDVCHYIQEVVRRDDHLANVVVNERSGGGTRFELHLRRPMEKGQVVELFVAAGRAPCDESSDGKCDDGDQDAASPLRKNFTLRHRIELMIASSSSAELAPALRYVESGLENLREHDRSRSHSVKSGALDLPDPVRIGEHLVARRRCHWVGARLRARLDVLMVETANTLSDQFARPDEGPQMWSDRCLETMQWNFDVLIGCKDSSVDAVKKEVGDEILYSASTKRLLASPYDESMWCVLSSELLTEQLNLVVDYIFSVRIETVASQKMLLDRLVSSAFVASNRLQNIIQSHNEGASDRGFAAATQNLGFRSLHIHDPSDYCSVAKLRSGASDDGAMWNLFSWHPSAMRKEVFACLADAHALRDAHELSGLDLPMPSGTCQPIKCAECTCMVAKIPWRAHPLANALQAHGIPRDVALFKSGAAQIHARWYLVNQILAVVHAVASVGIDWIYSTEHGLDEAVYSADKLLRALRIGTAASAVLMPNGATLIVDEKDLIMHPPPHQQVSPSSSYIPNSLPVFFNLVWPLLSMKYGWRTEADKQSGGNMFIQPQDENKDDPCIAGEKRCALDLKSALNDGIDIPRMSLALKSIVVKNWEHASPAETNSLSFPASVTVKSVLDKYLEMQLKKNQNDANGGDEARTFVEGLAAYFDEVLPMLLFPAEEASLAHFARNNPDLKSERHCENYGCEHLLRLLMMLPTLLRETGLPDGEIAAFVDTLSDLLLYLQRNYVDIFQDAYLLPHEEEQSTDAVADKNESDTVEPATSNNSLPQAVKSEDDSVSFTNSDLYTDTESGSTENEPLLRDEDRVLLTDFTYLVMEQVQLCKATLSDVSTGKRKGMRVGYSGLVCRHCIGKRSGGNATFFSGSKNSMATIPSVLYAHLEKCEFVPDDIKNSLQKLRSKHPEDRAKLQHGSQSLYYSRLWNRLHGSKNSSTKPVEWNFENGKSPLRNTADTKLASPIEHLCVKNDDSQADKEDLGSRSSFNCHKQVIECLGSKRWRERDDVQACLSAYYRCVALEGKLWNPGSLIQKR